MARVAAFCPFHFHRIFRAMLGETLSIFVKLRTHRPGTTLTEAALACGFASSSEFSWSLRRHYGVAPRRQRAIDWQYGTWLPSSVFVPGHQPVFEA